MHILLTVLLLYIDKVGDVVLLFYLGDKIALLKIILGKSLCGKSGGHTVIDSRLKGDTEMPTASVPLAYTRSKLDSLSSSS